MSDDWSLEEARGWLRDRVDEGARCPCCNQFAKVYRRKVHSAMAVALIKMWRAKGREWCEIADVLVHRLITDSAKLRYWDLIEQQEGVRDDGSTRIGFWRITTLGEAWVLNHSMIPKYARIYDGRCLGLLGEPVTIVDALGDKFDYRELMSS